MSKKTASQVASKVADKHKHSRQHPIGKAQETILSALGIESQSLNGFSHAQQVFDALGITVGNKRVGRKSVPVVSILFVEAGEDTYTESDNVDLLAISEYMI